jgi:hypothetical protein
MERGGYGEVGRSRTEYDDAKSDSNREYEDDEDVRFGGSGLISSDSSGCCNPDIPFGMVVGVVFGIFVGWVGNTMVQTIFTYALSAHPRPHVNKALGVHQLHPGNLTPDAFPGCGAATPGILEFMSAAKDHENGSADKVVSHAYQTMYGMHMMPFIHKPDVKILELGLGCTFWPRTRVKNGLHGSSPRLWRKLFPAGAIWVAGSTHGCPDRLATQESGLKEGINVLGGDETNRTVLQRWVLESGGQFDIIIDDAQSRSSTTQMNFDILWPALRLGGLYFIEDLHMSRNRARSTDGYAPMIDIVMSWADQLTSTSREPGDSPLPPFVSFVTCQREACVIGKGEPLPGNPRRRQAQKPQRRRGSLPKGR